ELNALSPSPIARLGAIERAATDQYLAGDLTAAEATIQQLATAAEGTTVDPLTTYVPHLVVIRYQQGRIAELLPLIERRVESLPGIRPYQAILVMALARTGRLDAATKTLNELAACDYDMSHDSAPIAERYLHLNWFCGTDALADGVEILGDRTAAPIL